MKQRQEIRIAHIASPKSWRGGEQQAVYLYEELNRLGIYQVFICSAGSAAEKYCKAHGFRYFSLKKRLSLDLAFACRLARICRKENISWMHPHDSGSHTLAILSKDFFRNPADIVLHRRVDFPVSASAFSRYKYNHPSIKKIICVSGAIRDIMKKSIPDDSKLAVIYDGIDTGRFLLPPGRKLRTEFNIPEEQPLIGNVAALAPHKDYFTFTDTVEILLEKGIKAAFLVIGDGPQEKGIKEYVKSKGLENNIIFTGFRTDIPEILPELDLLLFTSETEGLGTIILDAFACEVPVVSTNAGGIPEIISHLENGYLAEVKNPQSLAKGVMQALSKPEERLKWTKAASEKVRSFFTKEKTAEDTLNLYKNL